MSDARLGAESTAVIQNDEDYVPAATALRITLRACLRWRIGNRADDLQGTVGAQDLVGRKFGDVAWLRPRGQNRELVSWWSASAQARAKRWATTRASWSLPWAASAFCSPKRE